jgi:hypothetical protein
VPTCWLSGRMHAVWSPDGPQVGGTACMPYPVRLSGTGAGLGMYLGRVRLEPPQAELVGVGPGCQVEARPRRDTSSAETVCSEGAEQISTGVYGLRS